MSKLMKFIKSSHIQIALATGISIVILAYVSKRVLTKPMGNLSLAITPFLMGVYETFLGRNKNSKICTPWYWIVAIFAITALIILIHLT